MSNYSELLKDPRWQRKRLEILNRDNFQCQSCNDLENTLHVHHKSYEGKKEPWDVSNDNLITYCEVCHKITELAIKCYKDYSHNGIMMVKLNGLKYYFLHISHLDDNESFIVMFKGNEALMFVFNVELFKGFISKMEGIWQG